MKSPGEEDDVELWPYDILFIRDVPEWKLQDVVSVTGDVKFPGKYALESPNERLSDVIERAGGFTEDAFVAGAVFIRPRLSEEIKNRNLESIVQQTQEAVLDSEGNIVMAPFLFLYQTDQISRIIIDMERVMESKLEDDVILEGGDSINIPKTPTGANILGMVASNGTIRWIRGKRISYYIDRAGGLTRNADAGGIRLVKANGKVVKASLRTGSIEQGDAIIVPQRLKKKSDWMSVLSEAVTIVGGLATSLYILLNI
jgi:protein involved in polysaccharide export with SLBB domain